MSEIPKIIHLCCKTHDIPAIYKVYLKRMVSLHSEWDFYLHDDMQMLQIIESEFPEFLPIYNAYPCNIQRVDFFRILIIYLIGGFYMDLDMYCHKNLDDLCKNTIVLGEERICTDEEVLELNLEHSMQIANYMFGSVPKHPFWKTVIIEMITKSSDYIETENDVLKTTGPALLSNVYHSTKSLFKEILVLRNKTKICSKWCKRISCHFGEYAAHFHFGTWRWENCGTKKQISKINNDMKISPLKAIAKL